MRTWVGGAAPPMYWGSGLWTLVTFRRTWTRMMTISKTVDVDFLEWISWLGVVVLVLLCVCVGVGVGWGCGCCCSSRGEATPWHSLTCMHVA
jgi:hypothetical protein